MWESAGAANITSNMAVPNSSLWTFGCLHKGGLYRKITCIKYIKAHIPFREDCFWNGQSDDRVSLNLSLLHSYQLSFHDLPKNTFITFITLKENNNKHHIKLQKSLQFHKVTKYSIFAFFVLIKIIYIHLSLQKKKKSSFLRHRNIYNKIGNLFFLKAHERNIVAAMDAG